MSTNKVETDCTGINAGIERLLTDALAALTEMPGDEPHESAVAS